MSFVRDNLFRRLCHSHFRDNEKNINMASSNDFSSGKWSRSTRFQWSWIWKTQMLLCRVSFYVFLRIGYGAWKKLSSKFKIVHFHCTVGLTNLGYISDTARNRTHNLFRLKRDPIPLGHSDGLWPSGQWTVLPNHLRSSKIPRIFLFIADCVLISKHLDQTVYWQKWTQFNCMTFSWWFHYKASVYIHIHKVQCWANVGYGTLTPSYRD